MYILLYVLHVGTTITFKESSYVVKEDDGVFSITIQKFGETTEPFPVFIRTRASNPSSATRMCMINVIVPATFCINWQLFLAVTDYATTQNTVNFEAGSTSERKSEITVVPDDDFETNEAYIVTLFIRRSVLNRLNLTFMNSEALVTIENDDSKTKVYSLSCMCIQI